MKLCKALLQGCRAQPREDGRVFVGLVGLGPRESYSWSDHKLDVKTEKLLNVHVGKEGQDEFTDIASGQPLRPQLVHEARRKDM